MNEKKSDSKSPLSRLLMLVMAQIVSIGLDATALGEDLTVPRGTGTNLTASTAIDRLTINGPLTANGSGIAIVVAGATSVGPDNGDNASVSISDGAYQLMKSDVVYGENGGKGGTITVARDTVEMTKEGWGQRSGEYFGGTFGGYIVHKISSNLTADGDTFDLAQLESDGYFGVKQIYTENTEVKTRLRFNGGSVWLKPGCNATIFNAIKGAEIILEGVGANLIKITSAYGPTMSFMTGDGVVRVRGKGALRYRVTNSPEQTTTSWGAGVVWENEGGLRISGGHNVVKTIESDVLPFEKGGVTIENGRGVVAEKGTICNVLDLNGTTQKIHSLTLNTYSYVTNTSNARAVLEIGECATGEISLDGLIGGPIDVVIKSKFKVAYGTNLSLVGGARLLYGSLDLRNNRAEGGNFVGTVVVSNWNQHISMDASYVKVGASRDLPMSVAKSIGLDSSALMDIQNGALCVAKFSGSEGSSLHIHSNAALRVQSQDARVCKFLRFVFKEAIGLSLYPDKKAYPNVAGICLIDENGADYWPGDNGFVFQGVDTACEDMPAGSYKFHTDKYAVGPGPELDTVNVPKELPSSQLRSGDYAYSNDMFLKVGGFYGCLLFTNSIPVRSNAESWHIVTLRLKDENMKISGYRFRSGWDFHCYPGCWSVETSDDGVKWTVLDEKVDYYAFSYTNQSGGNEGWWEWNVSKDPVDKVIFPFLWTMNIAPNSVSFALNGSKVRVDRGGFLNVTQTGAPAEIDWLEIDAKDGAGRISSFKPLPNGVLDIVNVRTPGKLESKERKLAVTFDEVVDPQNLESWRVFSGGVEMEGVHVKLTETGLKVGNFGLIFVVR